MILFTLQKSVVMERTVELVELLSTVRSDNLVGLGIRIFLDTENDLFGLINELNSIAEEDPVFLEQTIGSKAMHILLSMRK